MNPNILGVIGPGFLNQVPTLWGNPRIPTKALNQSGRWRPEFRSLLELLDTKPLKRFRASGFKAPYKEPALTNLKRA